MNAVKFDESVICHAEKIVGECMGTEASFCKSRCPMHTDVKEYVKRISEKDYKGALKIIREKLFLPGTLGRICAHPCEEACRREKEFRQPISIAALKRFAADRADDAADWDVAVGENTGKHVAIVGSGPAGAQAAIDLRRAGHQVTIYEKMGQTGGMLRAGVPRHRLPREILDFEYSYLEKIGVEFQLGTTVGKDVSFQELREQYDAVLLANGAHKGNIIPIPGHDAKEVYSAAEFLKEVNLTGRFSGTGKRFLIVGGGDVAMDCARTALRIGAQKVCQCSLESREELPASPEEFSQAAEEGMACNFGWGPEEILVEDGSIQAVRFRNVTSLFDDSGRFHPEYGEETQTIEADTVIMATGQVTEDITDGVLKQRQGGRYCVDPETLAADLEGVFAAGDAAGGKIAVEAMALGRKAAASIIRYLEGRDLREDRDFTQEWAFETKLDVPLPEGTKDVPRIRRNLRPVEERIHDFLEADKGFTEEEAVEEASRCLRCECRLCMKECVMLEEYGKCPKEVFGGLPEKGELDMLQAYSCNDCGNCTIACPRDLPVREAFMESRRAFVEANHGEPPLLGHRPVKIHQTLGFYSMFTAKAGGEKDVR